MDAGPVRPDPVPCMFMWLDAAALAAAATSDPAATPAPAATPPQPSPLPKTPASSAPSAAPSKDGAPDPAPATAPPPDGPRPPPHVLKLLACHAADGRAAARKAAVQLVAVLVSLFRVARCPAQLQAASVQQGLPLLSALAADTSVSVRLHLCVRAGACPLCVFVPERLPLLPLCFARGDETARCTCRGFSSGLLRTYDFPLAALSCNPRAC